MNNRTFWPDGARLVISISMQFEAGGEAPYRPLGPLSAFEMKDGFPDFPTKSWYKYGYREGLLRMMDMWDKLGVKVTSHMVGSAIERNPDVAKEIVDRGHEAAAHGRDWIQQYDLEYADELKFIKDNVDSLERITGVRPVGYNGAAMRSTINTLKILQDLGFIYHIDDVSRDEPFLVPVRGKDFAVIPYSLQHNDIIQFERYNMSTYEFEQELKDEFDELYEEALVRRRMMAIATHDRIAGRPYRTRSLRRFFEYALRQPGVVCMRKDDIAKFTLEAKDAVRDRNELDQWADWESAHGGSRVFRVD